MLNWHINVVVFRAVWYIMVKIRDEKNNTRLSIKLRILQYLLKACMSRKEWNITIKQKPNKYLYAAFALYYCVKLFIKLVSCIQCNCHVVYRTSTSVVLVFVSMSVGKSFRFCFCLLFIFSTFFKPTWTMHVNIASSVLIQTNWTKSYTPLLQY